jgi:hypothetical protein
MDPPTAKLLNIKAIPREDPDTQQDVVVTYQLLSTGAIGVWQSDYPKNDDGPGLLADLQGDIGETFA